MEEPLFCPHCASVLDDHFVSREQYDLVKHVESVLTRDNAKLAAQIRRMQKDQRAQDESHPMHGDAQEVFVHWKRKLHPGAKELTGARLKAVLSRLEAGHTVDDLKQAVDGCAERPFNVNGRRSKRGSKDERFDELELICRSEEQVRKFRRYAPERVYVGDRPDALDEGPYTRMHAALTPALVDRLSALRGWEPDAIRSLKLGYDEASKRIVFPIRDGEDRLVGLCRYQPNPDRRNGKPKLLAAGTRDLFPAPETISAESVWLVEGEPDAVAMASLGYPAVGVPGVKKWSDEWNERFARFDRVRIVFDCDEEGRAAAAQRQADLHDVTDVDVIDLTKWVPGAGDHYDVGDLVLEQGPAAATVLSQAGSSPVSGVSSLDRRRDRDVDPRRPIERVLEELSRLDCRVRGKENQMEAQCPCHEDRVPSMSIAVGDDDRVLFTCHAGCSQDDVIAAMGLSWPELFASPSQMGLL